MTKSVVFDGPMCICCKTTYFEVDFYRISDVAKSYFSSNLTKLSLDLSKEVLYDSVGPRPAKLPSLKVRQ